MITRFLRCSNIIFNAQKRSKSVKSFSFLRPRIKEMVKSDKISWLAGPKFSLVLLIQPIYWENLENLKSTIYKPTYNVNRFQTVAPSGPRFGGAFGRVAIAAGNFIRRFLRPPTAVQRPFLRFMRPRRLQPIATKFMVDPAQVNLQL